MENWMVETQNLRKYYQLGTNTVKALDGVNFEVTEREFVSIVGKSGSGLDDYVLLTGSCEGEEVVQVYIGYENSKVDRPVKQLGGFARVKVQPGEEKSVSIDIPVEKLKWYNPSYRRWELESMKYSVYAGSSSAYEDLIKAEITL